MPEIDVLTIGSATVDHFMAIEQLFSAVELGDKILVKHLETHSGGGATNSAAALAKLGLRVRMLAKTGSDHDGEFIRREMEQYGVKNICQHHSRHHTDMSVIISSTQERDRVIFNHKGASLDLCNSDYRQKDLRAGWLYLGSLIEKSCGVAREIARHAHRHGQKLLSNPSLYLARKGEKYLHPILRATNVLVLNKEEAQEMLHSVSDNARYLLRELHKKGPEMVVITDGHKRLHALKGGPGGNLNNSTLYSLQPPKVKVVHTAGAGDAFTAGFLAGIIKKYPFEDALRLGQVNALSVIQHIGCKNRLLGERGAKEMMRKFRIKVSNDL